MRIAGPSDQAWVTIDLDRVAEAVAALRSRRGDETPVAPEPAPAEASADGPDR